ncbi:MAG: hypothetical protein ACREP9_19845, partial [Candidatus Dormibacteraceae bacterium]
RWPTFFDTAREGFSLAMLRCSRPDRFSRSELIVSKFEAFDIEDDGSAEWEFVVDLIAMLEPAVEGRDVGACLEVALRTYLQGMKNVLSNNYAIANGGIISHDVAMKQLAVDPEWARAVDFINAL